MKMYTKTGLALFVFSLMTLESGQALANHRGYGYAHSPITAEQQTAAQKIYGDYYSRTSALRQQLEFKRYEYDALLRAGSPDSTKINAVTKEIEGLRQALNEQLFKRDVAIAQVDVPRGASYDGHGHRGGDHIMGHW